MTTTSSPTPITIITGFLGSGKTTVLLNLIPQLPRDYKLCLLKNEFGDVAVDSQLADQASISGVTELLNGCICCNLVGQLSDALADLRTNFSPHRIIIETSGSTFPATLALEVLRISRETNLYTLDGVLQTIDVENWTGYADTSYTAKLQAKYTDLIILNKHELSGPQKEDEVMDRIRDVNEETPVVRSDKGWVDREVLLGLDGALSKTLIANGDHGHGIPEERDGHAHNHSHDGHSNEVEVLSLTLPSSVNTHYIDPIAFQNLLTTAPKDEIYRIKGLLRFRLPPPQHPDAPLTPVDEGVVTSPPIESSRWILNWAFGRWTWTAVKSDAGGVSTTIEATEAVESPEHVEADPLDVPVINGIVNSEGENGSVEAEEGLTVVSADQRARKGSIEVTVETSIQTTVESTRFEGVSQEAARISFVVARGEGGRWRKKLEEGGWVRGEKEGSTEGLRVERVL